MNWRIKGIAQKLLSGLPGGTQLNTLLQKTVGDLRNFERCVDGKVNDWEIFLSHMRELGVAPQGLDYLEVGTGWFPTFPVCFSLSGAASIQTFDITRHLNAKLSFRMLRCLESHLESIARAAGEDASQVQSRFRDLLFCKTIGQVLDNARIGYHAPRDAARTGLPNTSVDVVFSNSVLEHVPEASIRAIMHESFRVLRPGGFAVHSVNCGDHYAYFDRGISAIHYLSYSEKEWKPWNNSLLFQNRLRPQDFLSLAREAGLEIVLHRHAARPELLRELDDAKLAPQFRHYSPDQLAATSVDFIARRPKLQVGIHARPAETREHEAVSR